MEARKEVSKVCQRPIDSRDKRHRCGEAQNRMRDLCKREEEEEVAAIEDIPEEDSEDCKEARKEVAKVCDNSTDREVFRQGCGPARERMMDPCKREKEEEEEDSE